MRSRRLKAVTCGHAGAYPVRDAGRPCPGDSDAVARRCGLNRHCDICRVMCRSEICRTRSLRQTLMGWRGHGGKGDRTTVSRRTPRGGRRAVASAAVAGGASAKASKVYSAPALLQDKKVIRCFRTRTTRIRWPGREHSEEFQSKSTRTSTSKSASTGQNSPVRRHCIPDRHRPRIFSSYESHIEGWAAQGTARADSIIKDVGEDDFRRAPVRRRVTIRQPAQAHARRCGFARNARGRGALPCRRTTTSCSRVEALHGKDGWVGISSGVGQVPNLTTQFFAPYLYHSAGLLRCRRQPDLRPGAGVDAINRGPHPQVHQPEHEQHDLP